MQKILIVDDDDAMRGLMKLRLSDTYEVIDTGDPVQALELALEHKPAAILLDLMMPNYSGFELCQSFHSLSYTGRTPIFIISGESAAKYRDYVSNLGASGYFEKPIDFAKLKAGLATELQTMRVERRAHVRVRLQLLIKLKGSDADGKPFEEVTTTENISAGGFLCPLVACLSEGTVFQVFLAAGGSDRYAGRAKVARREAPNTPRQRYGFQFLERTEEWVLQR
jgi:putative two-component system response regulator